MRFAALFGVVIGTAALTSGQASSGSLDPTIQKIVASVSEERIAGYMARLESFETRNTLTPSKGPNHGSPAARMWLFEELKSFSPRLQVRLDSNHVKKYSERFFQDADVVNVVAVLPGARDPERQVIVSAHYDTIHVIRKPGTAEEGPGATDGEKSAAEPQAPGVSDDGSGTAAVLELARVMSQYEFDATIVFIAFDAEEYGSVGANVYATRAHREKQRIDAVLNNDIIGTETSGDGRSENRRVHVFSEEPSDSPSRNLARYVRDVAGRYVPSMQAEPVFRHDRFARGGDHTQFNYEGFAAVRITSAAEYFANQHSASDTLANASPGYTARVARVNAAALANLALAPKAPDITPPGGARGRLVTNIARGKSGYAARLRWKNENPEADLAGYKILMRSTTAPFWERSIFVGNVSEYTLESVSIDEWVFAVQAVDTGGHESLPSVYYAAPTPKANLDFEPSH